MLSPEKLDEHAAEVAARGYTVLEGVLDPGLVDALVADVERPVGRPQVLGDDCAVWRLEVGGFDEDLPGARALNADLAEFQTNLVPFPRIKFPSLALSPLHPLSRVNKECVRRAWVCGDCGIFPEQLYGGQV